jgi:hypothetical protein
LFIISVLKPSSFKLKTVKEIADVTYETCKKDMNLFNVTMATTYIMVFVYTIALALVIHNLLFIFITVLYIAWFLMDYSVINNYITKNQDAWSLTSVNYRYGSKVLDLMYFGYVIYLLIQRM